MHFLLLQNSEVLILNDRRLTGLGFVQLHSSIATVISMPSAGRSICGTSLQLSNIYRFQDFSVLPNPKWGPYLKLKQYYVATAYSFEGKLRTFRHLRVIRIARFIFAGKE